MDLLWPVEAHSDEPVVALEEGPPGIVQQDRVGLEGIRDQRPGGGVAGLERDDPLEE